MQTSIQFLLSNLRRLASDTGSWIRDGGAATSIHVAHTCRRNAIRQSLPVLPSNLKFCYFCSSWCVQGNHLEQHCGQHIGSLPKRCGSMVYCHTIIRSARPRRWTAQRHPRVSGNQPRNTAIYSRTENHAPHSRLGWIRAIPHSRPDHHTRQTCIWLSLIILRGRQRPRQRSLRLVVP